MLMRVAELKIGTIRSVDGAQIIIKAEILQIRNNGLDLHVEVGSFINCGGFHGDTICIVTRVYIEEVEKQNSTQINKIVELAIVGSTDGTQKFTRGIDHLPRKRQTQPTFNVQSIREKMSLPKSRRLSHGQTPTLARMDR